MSGKIDVIWEKARNTISDNDRVKHLLSEVKSRIDRLNSSSDEQSSLVHNLMIFVRMVRAHFSGKYKAFSIATILTVVFGLVYFITPMDLIPDFIPALGLTDDISLIYFILRSLAEDIANFQSWEESLT